jgi:hypothetical protein
LCRKTQECLMSVYQSWKRFHAIRSRARSDVLHSRQCLVQKCFDMWVAYTCRESLLSIKSNGLIQRSILSRRFSKVGTAGRAFFRWRNRTLKWRRNRRFGVFVSRLFKKGDKQMLASHFNVWHGFCKDKYAKHRINTNLLRKVMKLWRIECKIHACHRRWQLRCIWRAWVTLTTDRGVLQLRCAVRVLLRVLSRRNPSHISIAIETVILKSKSSIKTSALKPFCSWTMFVEMRRHDFMQLTIFFGKWKVFSKCSAKIRCAVICASKSFKRSTSALLKHSVDQFFISMTIWTAQLANDANTRSALLLNGMFERLRHQKRQLSLSAMSKKSHLHHIFDCWKSFFKRNSMGKWLPLQSQMKFAVQRLRSWTRRKRLCTVANQFFNRGSRSLLSFAIDLWKWTVLIMKKRALKISAVYNRLVRTALQRLLSATVIAWRLFAMSQSKTTPGASIPLTISSKRSSSRRDALLKDLNSPTDSDSNDQSP